MKTLERVLWIAAVAVLVAFAFGLRAAWLRDRAAWRATVEAAAASPVVIVKLADDKTTVEVWAGLPNSGEPSRLIAEYEPRDTEIYSDLRDALNGKE